MLGPLKRYLYRRLRTSFAKSGEDVQTWQILGMRSDGVFVDVGSHHPIRGSNTYFFYLRGWRGVCVDPNPRLVTLYQRLRPRDVFVNQGVSDRPGELTYYQFAGADSARNTFSQDHLASGGDMPPVEGTISVAVTTLARIFSELLGDGTAIDFLSVDCEGMDRQVLLGNDWATFRPRVVCVETHERRLRRDLDSPLTRLMADNGYELVGKSVLGPYVGSLFFVRSEDWA